MMEYKIFEHMSFDWMIVVYFFLGGIAAGSYLLSIAAKYWKRDLAPLALPAAVISPLALMAGMGLLLMDLGRPLGAWRLFLHFNPTSVLSWGVWFLNIFFVLSMGYLWFLFKGSEDKAKKFAIAGVPFALLVGAYTGVLLTQAPGRALWHSALIPPLFLLGGLISGIAIVLLVSGRKLDEASSTTISKFLGFLILAELGLTIIEMVTLFYGDAESASILKLLLFGEYSFLFWFVQIALGAILPAAILLRNKVSPAARSIATVLVLLGIFTMRYIVVIGGQVPTF